MLHLAPPVSCSHVTCSLPGAPLAHREGRIRNGQVTSGNSWSLKPQNVFIPSPFSNSGSALASAPEAVRALLALGRGLRSQAPRALAEPTGPGELGETPEDRSVGHSKNGSHSQLRSSLHTTSWGGGLKPWQSGLGPLCEPTPS